MASVNTIILVAGPTASGKSAFAVDLARRKNGTIINADAMQIYAGLPILSAQPDAELLKQVPHRLYGVIDPSEASSAGRWLALVKPVIEDVIREGRMPVLVGGTGLYFKALFDGLADIPEIPADVRDRAEKLYAEIGEEKFRDELAKIDPESAQRLARNDRQRLVRAYEVASHTGKAIGEWQKKSKQERSNSPPLEGGVRGGGVMLGETFQNKIQTQGMLNAPPPNLPLKGGGTPSFFRQMDDFTIDAHLLMPPRDEIYAACDRRFEHMIERGAIEEAKAFLERGLDPSSPAMKTIGVREIGSYLQGEITLAEAIAKSQQATRNYAKRQMTWFRNQRLYEKP